MKNNERNRMRWRAWRWWCVTVRASVFVLAAGAAVHASAQSAAAGEPAVVSSEVGHSTSAWLELQRSNAQAAAPQPMLGEEAGLAYRRYMQSFKSRIPDLYGSALNQGSGGGQGGGLTGQLPQN